MIFFSISLIVTLATDGYKSHQINVTTNNNNNYVLDFPEPPAIDIVKDDDWLPYKSPLSLLSTILEDEEEKICREDSSMDDFPDDLFSRNRFLRYNFVIAIESLKMFH